MSFEFDVLERTQSESAIEDGAWLHLNAPGTNNPLFRDARSAFAKGEDPKEPVRVRVRSIRSQAYQDLDRAEQRKIFGLQKQAKGKRLEELIREQIEGRRGRDFAVLVTGFENVSTKHDGVIEPSREELEATAKLKTMGWLVDQVFAFARDDENFGPLPEGGEAPQKSPRSAKASS